MKGIIMAGGRGTRLYPLTLCVNKHLLPIYDKPMIYYPLSVLMLAGIREILIVTNPDDVERFRKLIGDGSDLGMVVDYVSQSEPRGIADAFNLSKDFVGDDDVALILGDNIFFGHGLPELLNGTIRKLERDGGAYIFVHFVNEPQRYGVAEIDSNGNVVSIEEKPQKPKSNYAITGLYFFDNSVFEIAKHLKPSSRNELEITDVLKEYLRRNELKYTIIGRGFAWIDAGIHKDLLEASLFVATIERRQGLKIGCIEEVAYRMGWIDESKLRELANRYRSSEYGSYIEKLISD